MTEGIDAIKDNPDVNIIYFARGTTRWLNKTSWPQVRDIRNGSSYLLGFGPPDPNKAKDHQYQKSAVIILDQEGKITFQANSMGAYKRIEKEVNKLLPKAKGLLHGLDIPDKYKADMIGSYRNGQLAEVEMQAYKMGRSRPYRDLAKDIVGRIKADREGRITTLTALFEGGRYVEMFKEIDAFNAAYPRAKESRDIKKLIGKLRKNKATRGEYDAKALWDKVMVIWGKNQNQRPKELKDLVGKYPDSYWAKLATLLWIENNDQAGSPLPEKKRR